MTKKTWMLFIVIVAVVFGGLIWVSKKENTVDVESINIMKVQEKSADNGNIGEHTIGNKDAKVVVIEYGDYQCPGCSAAGPALKKAVSNYKDKVLLIFRNFPITTIHPNALAAAAAAESAGLQGKFWEMHELIYKSQNDWQSKTGDDRVEAFAVLATQLGLDAEKFKADLSNENVLKKIDFDKALAKKAGVDTTPSIYVNGEYITEKKVDNKAVWQDAQVFEDNVLKPAFEKAGVKL